MRNGVYELAIEAIDTTVHGAPEPHRVAHDRLEDGLRICRRLADDAQDLARGSFLIERLRQLTILFL